MRSQDEKLSNLLTMIRDPIKYSELKFMNSDLVKETIYNEIILLRREINDQINTTSIYFKNETVDNHNKKIIEKIKLQDSNRKFYNLNYDYKFERINEEDYALIMLKLNKILINFEFVFCRF